MKNIAIAADHAGYELKEIVKGHLEGLGYTVQDFGTHSTESMDYPSVAHPLAASIEAGENLKGITICGSGNGISMAANKHLGIRCALCWAPEIAKLAVEHNDANVLSIPARFVSTQTALEIVDTFFTAEFEGGRHQRRVELISTF